MAQAINNVLNWGVSVLRTPLVLRKTAKNQQDTALEAAQRRVSIDGGLRAAPINALVGVLAAVTLWSAASPIVASVWTAAIILTSITRFMMSARLQRSLEPATLHWKAQLSLICFANALTWGSSAFVFNASPTVSQISFLTLINGAVIISGGFSCGMSRVLLASFVVPIVTGQVIYHLFAYPGENGYVIALTQILFLFFVFSIAYQYRAAHFAAETADAASAAKSAFLRTMSHELRTPLNAIIGFADLLKQQNRGPLGSEDYVGYADHIRNGGQDMLDIVTTVLEVASLDEREARANASDVSFEHILDDAIAGQSLLAKQRHVRVVVDESDVKDTIHIEERAVRQALEAVLNNALWFSPEGGEVRIATYSEKSRGHIMIQDDGPGMDEDTRARAFNPFEKGGNSITADHGGVGLGLTLAKAIAEANGGSLTLASAPGEGTTVVFTFPRTAQLAKVWDAA